MRTNHWVLCGMVWMTAVTVPAQEAKPAAAVRNPALALAKDTVLEPPTTANVTQEAVNVRGQPSFGGEVVTHVKHGQTVTVLEQFTLAKPKKGEPADWSRIALPTDASAYVFADYIDTKTMTVSVTRINVRGGPGENFSILARLEKGAPVKEVRRAQNWIQIEPPTNAYGFVASEYLVLQSPAAPPPATAAAAPEPVNPAPAAPVVEPAAPVVANPPVETAAVPPPAAPAPAPVVAPEPVAPPPTAMVAAPLPAPSPEPAKVESPLRIVTREGFVRRTTSLVAPTAYELHDIRSGELTEFLFSNDVKFKAYLDARVSVTGPEVMDHRWLFTPVLQVETIFLMP